MLELIIIVLLAFIALQEFFNRKERKGLIEAIMAKSLQDLGELEIVRGVKQKKDKPLDDIVPVNELSDEKFDEFIKEENDG